MGWISALPWNQAPAELRGREVEKLPLCSSEQPGVHAVAQREIVHGQEYLCVLKYSSAFASEQLHSITTSLTKVLQSLRRLSMDLAKPGCRSKETLIRNKIQRWLSSSAYLGRSDPMEARFAEWTLAFTVRLQPSRFPKTADSSSGTYPVTDESHGLER